MSKKKLSVIIVAAGRGTRAGGGLPKQYQDMAGVPLLRHTVMALHAHTAIDDIICVIHRDDRAHYDAATDGLPLLDPVDGGDSRQQSVFNGLQALQDSAPDIVLIHDAARPFVSIELIDGLVTALDGGAKAALPALPVVDTLKFARNNVVEHTVDRENLYRAQTPQAFVYTDILAAHIAADGASLTDDIAVAERANITVALTAGDEDNIKLTTQEDFERAEEFLMQNNSEIRTGQGFDVHRFTTGDHVWLCGVKIPHTKALKGHSDADVAMHALTDALYGAISAGDIGVHFPPSDEQWKGAPSHIFLEHATKLITDKGGYVANVDVTIICEAPKIAPHHDVMRARLAEIMDINADRISVKATTTEQLGFTGRGEGIAAQAIATVSLPNGDKPNGDMNV